MTPGRAHLNIFVHDYDSSEENKPQNTKMGMILTTMKVFWMAFSKSLFTRLKNSHITMRIMTLYLNFAGFSFRGELSMYHEFTMSL